MPQGSAVGTVSVVDFSVWNLGSQLPATNPLGEEVTQPSVFAEVDVPVTLPFPFPGEPSVVHEHLFRQESLAEVEGAGRPVIASATFAGGSDPTVTLTGSGFGTWPEGAFACAGPGDAVSGPDEACPALPASVDSAFLQVAYLGPGSAWSGGSFGEGGQNSSVGLTVESWSPTQVAFTFSGSYPSVPQVARGASLAISLWNPQTLEMGQWEGAVP
jgi:hypothetical protein